MLDDASHVITLTMTPGFYHVNPLTLGISTPFLYLVLLTQFGLTHTHTLTSVGHICQVTIKLN